MTESEVSPTEVKNMQWNGIPQGGTGTENTNLEELIPVQPKTITTENLSWINWTSSSSGWLLTILMPGRFYNKGFQQLAQKIKTDYNITIHYKTIENIAYFRQIIRWQKKSEDIDVYLVPSDRMQWYQGKNIWVNEDITPYFDAVFSKYISGESTTFIPYAIDPLITIISDTNTTLPNTPLTFKDIASFIVEQWAKNKIRIPLVRWIDKNDKRLLEQWGESFPNYFLITYTLINEILAWWDSNDLNIFENTINDPSISRRTYANFKLTFSKLLKKNKYCVTFPDICIIAYNLWDSKFGFLSDIAIQKKYFGWSGQITTPMFYGFPVTTGGYKVRWRWFVGDQNSKNDENMRIFLREYLAAGVQNTIPLWEDTLSAFNTIFDIQKIQKKYEPILQFQSVFSLMRYGPTLQQDFLANRPEGIPWTDLTSIMRK